MVDYIEEDQEFTIASTTNLWHLDRIDQIDLPLNHQYSTPNNGSNVDIYILDSGECEHYNSSYLIICTEMHFTRTIFYISQEPSLIS